MTQHMYQVHTYVRVVLDEDIISGFRERFEFFRETIRKLRKYVPSFHFSVFSGKNKKFLLRERTAASL